MRHLRYAASLFFLGWLVGTFLGSIGYTIPAFLSWRFSLLDINSATFRIILNNLAAASITALGPYGLGRFLKINRSDPEGMTFLYMTPTLILFLNGFSAGYFTGSLIGQFTPLLIAQSILPHGVLEIPAIIISGAIGFTNVEELDNQRLFGKKFLPLILILILVGGYVEGNVTSNLPQLRNPIEIIAVDAPAKAEAGMKFPVTVTVENSGIIRPGYFLALYSASSDRVYERGEFPPGRSTISKEIAIYAPGSHNITASIIDGTSVLSSRNFMIEVTQPRISIVDVGVPRLYSGEDAIINITIENGDESERSVELAFRSSTGAVSLNAISLPPRGRLVYPYATLIGQPGPRRFEIELFLYGTNVSQKIVEAEALGLRIKPVIASVFMPELRVNRTSTLSIEVENIGTRGGNVSLLILDSKMPQLLRQGDTVAIVLNRQHLGTGLLAEKELYLEVGEKRKVEVETTPREIGSSNLLIFTLRREVISDARNVEIDVKP